MFYQENVSPTICCSFYPCIDVSISILWDASSCRYFDKIWQVTVPPIVAAVFYPKGILVTIPLTPSKNNFLTTTIPLLWRHMSMDVMTSSLNQHTHNQMPNSGMTRVMLRFYHSIFPNFTYTAKRNFSGASRIAIINISMSYFHPSP